MTTQRIVTSCKGSWKWQNAYKIATYTPSILKNGKTVWKSCTVSTKFSMPQIKRMGYDHLVIGSLHNVPLTRDEADYFVSESKAA